MVIVVFAFSSCGDKTVTPMQTATPQETITKVLENLKQVKSMKSVITTQSNMTAGVLILKFLHKQKLAQYIVL